MRSFVCILVLLMALLAQAQEMDTTYVIDEQGLTDALGLELVMLKNDQDASDRRVMNVVPFELVKVEGNLYTFECSFEVNHAGSFKTAVRMFPKNNKLPHRQDFCYVKWLD